MGQFIDSELDDPQFLLAAAAEIYEMRRARDDVLPGNIVGEPGWDILLALYVGRGRQVTVGETCRSSRIPASTALRWILALQAQDLVHCDPSESVSSLSIVSLTRKGGIMIDRCLKAMLRVSRG